MYDFIFLFGAQGSGKTTLARLLKARLDSPHIDYDWVRGFHLNNRWSNVNDEEAKMSFENLVFILKSYKRHDYKNVIVGGFTEKDITNVLNEFKDDKYIVITLYLSNDDVLKERVLTETRDSGFRDYESSIRFNKKLKEDLKFSNEHKIDNTNQSPEKTLEEVIRLLS